MNLIEQALKRTTDTKALILETGAMEKTAQMFQELFPYAPSQLCPTLRQPVQRNYKNVVHRFAKQIKGCKGIKKNP